MLVLMLVVVLVLVVKVVSEEWEEEEEEYEEEKEEELNIVELSELDKVAVVVNSIVVLACLTFENQKK